MSSNDSRPARRPLKSRQHRWAQASAAWLAKRDISPNHISLASLVFALGACISLALAARLDRPGHIALLAAAVACIQLRLLCNLLDGLVAVEGGKRTPTGELFNDAPDRAADVAIFLGAGYGLRACEWGVELGWAASVIAVGTAYVRYLGATMGAGQIFIGPMAKQHRMAVMTVASLLAAVETAVEWPGRAIPAALGLVIAGGIVTVIRRLRAISRAVDSAA